MKLHRRVLTFWLVLVTLGGWTVLSRQNISCNKNKTLSVIGLFGKTGQYDIGDISEHGAQLAVNDINSRKDILPGYKIALLAEDTKSDVSTGMEKLLYHLFECPTKVMVLGASTSYVTTYTAAVSRRWNLVQISFSATDPALSNKSKFPWFFRTSLSTEVYSQAFIKLMQNFQWFNFSVIQESYRLFTSTEETMKRYLNNTDITINTVETFDNNLENAIAKLKSKDARIIYVAAFENKARQAVCAAFRNNFYGPRRVWILQGYYSNRWYEINDTKCSASEILQVIDGYFTIAPSHYNGNDTVSKMSISDVYCRYKTLRNQSCDPHYKDNSVDDLQGLHYMPLAYDAMWAVALALHKTLTDLKASGSGGLENFTYTNTKLAEKIYENMRNVSFRGISGDIAFSPKGDRVATVSVFQFQQNSGPRGGVFVEVGRQRGPDLKIKWNNTRIYWPKGKPVSVRPTKKRLIPLSKEKYIAMCALAALGMLTSAVFLTFNIAYRNVRMIKMSSPKINNLILIGCLVFYSSIFIEDVFLSGLSVFCYAKLYMAALGFYTAFGALFSKTWRVYKIMSADLSFRGRDLQDRHLFLRVAVLVIFNLLLLVVWTSVDPFTVERQTEGQPKVNEEKDIKEIFQSLGCRSEYSQYLNLVLMSTQGLLILFGAFLAWQTRKVSIPELNDSRWIGMCIYNVVLLGSLRAILVMGTHQTPEMTYLTDSVIAFIGASVTQYFIFVPKVNISFYSCNTHTQNHRHYFQPDKLHRDV